MGAGGVELQRGSGQRERSIAEGEERDGFISGARLGREDGGRRQGRGEEDVEGDLETTDADVAQPLHTQQPTVSAQHTSQLLWREVQEWMDFKPPSVIVAAGHHTRDDDDTLATAW